MKITYFILAVSFLLLCFVIFFNKSYSDNHYFSFLTGLLYGIGALSIVAIVARKLVIDK